MAIGYLLLFWIMISGFSSALAETLYVKTPSAELKNSTAATAQVVAQLPRGTALTVKSKQGNWIEVTAGGKTGWVYRFKVSTTKPSGGGGDLLAGLGGGGAKAREGSTAVSMRGLSPTSEKYAGRANITPAHIDMVKHMEAVKVDQAQVATFLKDGKLGEYGDQP
jgi:uncharacterized protein YgiM (DUF1202 family)